MTENSPSPYIVTARVRCEEPDLIAHARLELSKLAAATLNEPGCISFMIHEEHENPGSFIMWESFTDVAAFRQHFVYPHTAAYVEQHLTTVVEHWVTGSLDSTSMVA